MKPKLSEILKVSSNQSMYVFARDLNYLGAHGQDIINAIKELENENKKLSLQVKKLEAELEIAKMDNDNEAEEISELDEMLSDFLDHSKNKVETWLRTPNPLLGNVIPFDMIKSGQAKKLFNLVKSFIDESKVQ